MKKILITICGFLFVASANAQLECDERLLTRVVAESGLNMRAEPSLSARVVTGVPFDSLLTVCRETAGKLTVEDISGFWRKAEYKGQTGYMFDGFLEIISIKNATDDTAAADSALSGDSLVTGISDTAISDTAKLPKPEAVAKQPAEEENTRESPTTYQFVTEAYNFCGDVEGIDPGMVWYGFYPSDPENGRVTYRIEPVELSVVLSRTRLGKGLEFDIETDREERSIFLLGLSRKGDIENLNIKDKSEMLRYAGRKVFPGQELTLSQNGPNLNLSATGSVKSSGPCPKLEGYKLMLTSPQLGVEQNLSAELPRGKCGMPEIYWFGDFTGDGIPEIIFVSVYEDRNTFSLFISNARQPDKLLRKEAEFTLKDCNE